MNTFKFSRKRTVMCVFLVLFVYGLFVFIYSEVGLLNRQQYRFRKLIGGLVNNKVRFETNGIPSLHCPVLNINSKNTSHIGDIICKEHQPSDSGCIFANKAYAYDDVKRNCGKDTEVKICDVQNGKFKCSRDKCDEDVTIYIFNSETGKVSEVASKKKSEELEVIVTEYAKKTIKTGFKFLFLSCGKDKVQLISLNDILFEKKTEHISNRVASTKININIVMLDSLSRAHFYRSLHQTIAEFKSINTEGGHEVLDFKLFQALHGHSAENAHGLFTGNVFDLNLTDSQRESLPVGIQDFYRYFHSKGYDTLYQDDMCWEAVWGFRSDIGGASDWEDLYKKLHGSSINDTGLMFANCKVFEKFGTDHIFNLEEENYVCYNGKQYNAYFLQYVLDYFTSYDAREHRRSMSYTALNAAHDYGGVRIQALDKDLSSFVKSMTQLDNTLTVILADHGNTYTDFVYIDLEGRYEMFHPALFMVIPDGVQRMLGNHKMNILRGNQEKLLSMIDLHHSFKYLADPNYPSKGIFEHISATKGCSNIPLRFPNYCVCEGWDTVVVNDTELAGHLEFAVGQLNNMITKTSSGGMCKRLVPTVFKNVLQRKDGDYQITSFEIETLPGKGIESNGEKINVEVKAKLSGSLSNHEMELMSWDRASRFGIYRECSDAADTKFRLCVCDKDEQIKFSNIKEFYRHRTSEIYNIFDGTVNEKFDELIENNLVAVIRTHKERKYDGDKEIEPYLVAVSFEVINFSTKHNTSYSITIIFDSVNNMKQLTKDVCSVVSRPGTIMYLCTLARKWSIWQGEYSYKVAFTAIP